MKVEGQARLFFALWPGSRVRGALDRAGRKLCGACGGRRMRAPSLHLTLVFLGNVELARIDALRAVAQAIAAQPFAVTFDKLGWWRHNRVAWAAPEVTPERLTMLVKQLQGALREAGFAFDDRPSYVPHVTLLRNARCEGVAFPPFPPLEWRADEFVLLRSVTGEEGAAYEIIGRWELKDR